jgi:hypothetical protein
MYILLTIIYKKQRLWRYRALLGDESQTVFKKDGTEDYGFLFYISASSEVLWKDCPVVR